MENLKFGKSGKSEDVEMSDSSKPVSLVPGAPMKENDWTLMV